MTAQTEKLKLIYKPFLIIAICIIMGYTFLNWILFKKLQLFSLNEEMINLWLPLCLPWIPLLIWLRPYIKLLNLKTKKGNLPSLYIFVAGFAIAAPTMVAQSYLETASGELTRLENINQITKQKTTKYYILQHLYIDKTNIGVQNDFDVSGKNNEYLNMNLYIVLPILNVAADTATADCAAWYGIKYHKQISNRLDENEKEERFKTFADESQADFNEKNVNDFIYFDRIGNTDDHKEYSSAIKKNKKYSDNSSTVLIPVNEPFETRNGNKLAWIFGAFAIGATVWLIMILLPKLSVNALQELNNNAEVHDQETKEFSSFFLPRKGFFITPVIMDLNILIFLIMSLSGLGFISFRAIDLLAWGANCRPATINGEWWRLLTSIFLHGGVMHLLANMYGLIFIGIMLEPRVGKTKYAFIYFLTGIVASLTSLWWHNATVSVGASGAIFGLYGAFLALLLAHSLPQNLNKAFLASTLIFVGYNLLMGLSAGIDNAAHIGGLTSGFLIGLILSPQIKKQRGDEILDMPTDNNQNENVSIEN